MDQKVIISENSVEDSAIDDRTLLDQTSEKFHEIGADQDSSSTHTEVLVFSKMAESRAYQLHRFNGQNYQLWQRQMQIYMTENKLKSYILGTIPRPASNTQTWDDKDAEAQAFIMRGLELEQLKYLTDCMTAAQMWSRLKTVHSQRSEQSAQVLLEKFINCRMDEEESMADYIARVTSLAQRLKDMDLEQREPMVIAKILSSLPTKFDHVRTAWYAVPRTEQNIERLTDHLVNEESLINLRLNNSASNLAPAAAYTARSNKIKWKNNNKGINKVDRPKRAGKCNYCQKQGHWARECLKRQKDQQAKHDNENEVKKLDRHSLMVQRETKGNKFDQKTSIEERSHLFILHSVAFESKIKNVWYADSGATDHMSFQRECFKNFVPFSEGTCQVRVGDGRKLSAKGIGDIEVQVTNLKQSSPVHTIKDVLFVPDLSRNFISVSRSAEKGIKVIFEEGAQRVSFIKNNVVIVDGFRDNRLYKMNMEPVKTTELNFTSSGSLMLWHERLGHVNFKTLREMNNNGVVNDLKIDKTPKENPFCEGCAYGKQHRLSFPKSGARRTSIVGETFHVDLCGKMSTPSIGGANYFMLLKDDFSRYCYVYFLKSKTDVLDNLKKFYSEVEADGHKIKKLRSDGGLEFCNESVKQFLLTKGIKHQISTPNAPEQNGFIERQNRTIIESAKAMLHERQLPLYLWAEATYTAVYLKNRTASDTIGGATPYEKWFGLKPSVGHLRVFGCEVYVHIPKEQRTKWEKNSIKCQMVGYHDDSKAYRIYDPARRRILIRRDVIFKESRDRLHEITEAKTMKNLEDYEAPEEGADQSGEEPESSESGKLKRIYKNPRLPIPRSPYYTRSSRLNEGESEDAAMEGEVFLAQMEPRSLEEAMESQSSMKWLTAINEEIDSLEKNNTWILVPRTEDKHVITNRWIFKKKYRANGEIEKFKARLVARGCSQKYGIDYEETFAPVVKYESVRTLLAIAAAQNFEIYQFDIKTAFLHGDLEENIYMEQPYGFEEDDRICLLKKSIYGLKQASRQWNKKIVEFLVNYGLRQIISEPCIFIFKSKDCVLYLALYVDDGLICGNKINFIKKLLDDLHRKFEITFKEAEFFIGLQIKRDRSNRKLKIYQSVYTKKILERFNHMDCFPVSTPAEPGMKFSRHVNGLKETGVFPYREAIGSLMYLMVCTRPDIAYIVCVLSRFMEKPTNMHWQGIKRILKFLKGTAERGITFDLSSGSTELTVFSDADWAGDIDTRRSTTGWIAILNGGAVAWSSRKQSVTATSTTEAEFVALCATTKAVVWLRRLMSDLYYKQNQPTPIGCDNQRAITLVKNPESSKRTKHIDTQYFYTCDMQEKGEIDVHYVPTKDQLADPLTKALQKDKFRSLVERYGLCDE